MRRTVAIAALTLVLGLAIGFVWGRITAPGPPRLARSAAAGDAADQSTSSPTPGSVADRAAALVGDPDAVGALREMASQAFDWGASPKRVVRSVIDQMSDDELVALVSSLTDFTGDELRDGRDLRGFVERLASVAMDGVLTDPAPIPPGVRPVQFATRVARDNAPVDTSSRFRAEDERIYAVFESEDIGAEQIFAKWTRTSDREVMLFGRYTIEPGDQYSYVWLGRPGSGWTPGEYRVDFYTADTDMTMLASGLHVISK